MSEDEQIQRFNAVAAIIVAALSDDGVEVTVEGGANGHITWGLVIDAGEGEQVHASLALSRRIVPTADELEWMRPKD